MGIELYPSIKIFGTTYLMQLMSHISARPPFLTYEVKRHIGIQKKFTIAILILPYSSS